MKNIKKLVVLMFAVLLMFTWTACTSDTSANPSDADKGEETDVSETTYPLTITDNLGNEITFDAEPETIVSVSPEATETIFALGIGDRLVGVTDYCDYPEEAKEKEKVGGYANPNTEKIIELAPDVLFAFSSVPEDAKQIIEASNIKVVVFNPEDIDGVLENIKLVGEITNTQEKAAELVESMSVKRQEVVSKVEGQESRKVFIDLGGYYTVGPGSFIDSMLQEINAENIASDAETQWPQLSVEKIIEADPDVYISTYTPIDDIKSVEGFDSISAYQNDRIVEIPNGTYENSAVQRSGPRVVEGLEILAKAIYPEAFE